MGSVKSDFESLCQGFKEIDAVAALALGGSRASDRYDKSSDYDLYVYTDGCVDKEQRYKILQQYCSRIELNNQYFETEDDCTLNDGTDIDIIYRDISAFEQTIKSVVIDCIAYNSYTTCMWFNLVKSAIVYDKDNRLESMVKRYSIPYPEKLRENQIKKGLSLLSGSLPSYDRQIIKAYKRGDTISVNHRISAFIETYFEVLFAVNKFLHPGEKRMLEWAETLQIRPVGFAEDMRTLFSIAYTQGNDQKLCAVLSSLYENLKAVSLNALQLK